MNWTQHSERPIYGTCPRCGAPVFAQRRMGEREPSQHVDAAYEAIYSCDCKATGALDGRLV